MSVLRSLYISLRDIIYVKCHFQGARYSLRYVHLFWKSPISTNKLSNQKESDLCLETQQVSLDVVGVYIQIQRRGGEEGI